MSVSVAMSSSVAGRHHDAAGGDLDHRLGVRLGPERVALRDRIVQRRRVPLLVAQGVERHRAVDLGQPADTRRRIAALLILRPCLRRRGRRALCQYRPRHRLRCQQGGNRDGGSQTERPVLRTHVCRSLAASSTLASIGRQHGEMTTLPATPHRQRPGLTWHRRRPATKMPRMPATQSCRQPE